MVHSYDVCTRVRGSGHIGEYKYVQKLECIGVSKCSHGLSAKRRDALLEVGLRCAEHVGVRDRRQSVYLLHLLRQGVFA